MHIRPAAQALTRSAQPLDQFHRGRRIAFLEARNEERKTSRAAAFLGGAPTVGRSQIAWPVALCSARSAQLSRAAGA